MTLRTALDARLVCFGMVLFHLFVYARGLPAEYYCYSRSRQVRTAVENNEAYNEVDSNNWLIILEIWLLK